MKKKYAVSDFVVVSAGLSRAARGVGGSCREPHMCIEDSYYKAWLLSIAIFCIFHILYLERFYLDLKGYKVEAMTLLST